MKKNNIIVSHAYRSTVRDVSRETNTVNLTLALYCIQVRTLCHPIGQCHGTCRRKWHAGQEKRKKV